MLRYGVEAYVCGHDHNLQHIQNLTDPDSMDYVISGAGGGLPTRYIPAYDEYIRATYNVTSVFFKLTYGFVTLTTHVDQMRFDFYDQDAVLLYSFSRYPRRQTMERRRRRNLRNVDAPPAPV